MNRQGGMYQEEADLNKPTKRPSPLQGVSLADALRVAIENFDYSHGAVLSCDVIADLTWRWFRANRDTLDVMTFTPTNEAAQAIAGRLYAPEKWLLRDFLSPVLDEHFYALLEAAQRIGEER